MPKFTDADGREWRVDVTLEEIKQVRADLEIDLLDVGSKELFARLVNDPVLIVDVLYVVLRKEADARSLDAVGFARGLRGDAVDDASRALLEALVAFFPKRRRAVLQAAVTKTNNWMEATANHAVTVIESEKMDRLLTATMEKMTQTIDQQLAELSGSSAPNGPPSPASSTTA